MLNTISLKNGLLNKWKRENLNKVMMLKLMQSLVKFVHLTISQRPVDLFQINQ